MLSKVLKTCPKVVAGLALAASIGCGGTGAEAPEGSSSSGGEASSYAGPIASTDLERGAERFETFCGGCHPGGEEDVGPSLIADPHSPERVRQQIREGSGRMRPFSQARLSDADMETVLAYMASIGAVTTPSATPATSEGAASE